MSENVNEAKWIDVTTPARLIKTFRLGEYPELIHIIRTGFNDKYIVVYEDAYELHTGKTEMMNKAQVEEKFGITL